MSNTTPPTQTPFARRIFANRTLNLRSIRAVGYDMDYTLVHYHFRTWEERAYARLQELLVADGWPVGHLRFDHDSVIRGLIVDSELGNLVKANRFGYVMRAAHGTRMMDFEEQRDTYRHIPVELSDPRFIFLNTLFSLSETCLYSQLVDLFDDGRLPGVNGYEDLFRKVRVRMDETHVEGTLKAEIAADPARFIDLDPDAALALMDQKRAGKRLMLISNAEWEYAREIMTFAFDPFLAPGETWRDLFELIIVGARKPAFFSQQLPIFRVVDEAKGLLEPVPGAIPGPGIYLGGDATKIEDYLGLSGSQILYVGDHVFADVHMSKASLRWRTALDPPRARRGTPRHRRDRRCRGETLAIDGRERGSRTTPLLGPARAPAPLPALRRAERPSDRGDSSGSRRSLDADGGDRQAGGAAGKADRRGLQLALGHPAALGIRPQPSRAPGRAIRRHLHIAGVEFSGCDALRLSQGQTGIDAA